MAEEKQLHPSVKKFKEFVANNPHLVREVREGQATWQQLYEEWYLLGVDDPRWNRQETGEKQVAEVSEGGKGDWMHHVVELAKKVEPGQIQTHLNNLSQALGAIQGVISQFQKTPSQPPPPQEERAPFPFPFRKD
jgi:Putative coat protein